MTNMLTSSQMGYHTITTPVEDVSPEEMKMCACPKGLRGDR